MLQGEIEGVLLIAGVGERPVIMDDEEDWHWVLGWSYQHQMIYPFLITTD